LIALLDALTCSQAPHRHWPAYRVPAIRLKGSWITQRVDSYLWVSDDRAAAMILHRAGGAASPSQLLRAAVDILRQQGWEITALQETIAELESELETEAAYRTAYAAAFEEVKRLYKEGIDEIVAKAKKSAPTPSTKQETTPAQRQ
jgi:hypothetical protein